MKLTRKLISLVLSLLLIASMTAVTAFAAKGDTIYFEKPDDWDDSIYIYYWDSTGAKPSSLYDYAFTQVEGNIYSYTCTAGFTEFLIDDGSSGKHQTVNLKFPGDGYICKVLSTGSTNEWGNFCNNAEWSKYDPNSQTTELSVSASPKDGDFVDKLSVKLTVTKAESGTYSINGSAPVSYTNGEQITIGADAEIGDVITLTLKAQSGADTAEQSYKYTKVKTPPASSAVYFDNSKTAWDEVYIYSYGTKEIAEWPGVKMQLTDDGLYYYAFGSAFSNENIIVNNGKDTDDGKEQFPKNSGLNIKKGECKLLTADLEWVDYGTPDSKPAGFAYTANGTAFSTNSLNVKIGLKNAVKGTYQVDGGTVFDYTGTTTVSVGQGAIGNKEITLTLSATDENNTTTVNSYTYKKTFSPSKTTFSSPSDGHTSEAVDGYYGTNPNMQLGKSKTITVDGNPSDWDKSMIIAQGVANDDPRVYMPSSMHEQPWDDYALYAAWDDDNLYFMWEMANTTYVVSPSDNFAASQEARPWRNSIPMFIALSIDPEKHADGTAWGTDSKTGAEFTNPFVWGCDGGTAKDGGISFKTNIDTLIAFDTNNSNGGSSIFKADKYDAANDNYMFNYDTAIPIGVTSYEKQDNRNGFKIAHDYGTLSTEMYGVGGAKGSHTLGDSLDSNSNWVDFFDLGYKNNHGFIYEVAIPLKNLGIDKSYIETNGIGAMQLLTYGTSGMDCLPYDATMQDNADVEYSYDPSTSHEKEDVDTITVPLARVGALLSDTVVNKAPFEVNFGTDKAGTQGLGTQLTLKAEPYNGTPAYTYKFTVNGQQVQSSASDSYAFTPNSKGTYTLGVTVTDGEGKTAAKETSITVGDEPVEVTETPEPVTTPPTDAPKPSQAPETPTTTDPENPTESGATEPTETVTYPTNPDTTLPTEPTPTDPTQATDVQPSGVQPTETETYPTNPDSTLPDSTDPTGSEATTPTELTDPTQSDATLPTETVTQSDSTAPTNATQAPTSAPQSAKLNKTSLSLKAGKTFTLKVTGTTAKATFTTSKKSVVKVSKNGKLTALKKGGATITVKAGTETLKCKVKVTTSPKAKIKGKAVKAKKAYTIKKGKTLTVKLTGKAASIKNKYTSTKKKIAKIKSKKTARTIKISALKKGSATVKIKINGVKTIKIKVKVV